MNIGIFTDTYFPDRNILVATLERCREVFADHGHTVTVFCPKIGAEDESTPSVWRIGEVGRPFKTRSRIGLAFSSKIKQIPSLNLDVIHSLTAFNMGYVAKYVADKYHLPIIYTYQPTIGMDMVEIPVIPINRQRKETTKKMREFYNKCDYVIVGSNRLKSRLESEGLKTHIATFPMGLHPDTVKEMSDPNIFVTRYGLPSNKRFLVYNGPIRLDRQIHFLIEVFKRVHKKCPDTHLLMIGEGPQRDNAEQKVRQLKLTQSVDFLGTLPFRDQLSAYRAATLSLFPAKSALRFGAILKGFSSGVPAVCTRTPETEELFPDDRGGLLADPVISDFASKALKILTSSKLIEAKRKEALAKAIAVSVDEQAPKVLSLYEHVASHYKD